MLTRRGLMVGTLAMAALVMPMTARAYSPAVEQWRSAAEGACADQGCVEQIMALIACESGGDPGAWHPNPNGGSDVGLLQINDATWGDVAYADGASQIQWTAQNLGTVWWACQG